MDVDIAVSTLPLVLGEKGVHCNFAAYHARAHIASRHKTNDVLAFPSVVHSIPLKPKSAKERIESSILYMCVYKNTRLLDAARRIESTFNKSLGKLNQRTRRASFSRGDNL